MNYTTFSNAWTTTNFNACTVANSNTCTATINSAYTTYSPYTQWDAGQTSNGYSDPWQASYEVRYDPPTPKKPSISMPPNDDGKELFTDEELSELLDD